MKYKSVSNTLIILNFSTCKDQNRALYGGPWNYKNCPIIFMKFDSLQRPSEIEFRFLPIWVRVYDLPLGLMNCKTARLIGGLCGEVLEVDLEEEGLGWGEFLRARVKLDITKPLRRGVMLKTPRSKNQNGEWFEIKYERLPFYCFYCGLVGNDVCGCSEGARKEGKEPQYSDSLRAPIASWGVEVEKMGRGSTKKDENTNATDGRGVGEEVLNSGGRKGTDEVGKQVPQNPVGRGVEPCAEHQTEGGGALSSGGGLNNTVVDERNDPRGQHQRDEQGRRMVIAMEEDADIVDCPIGKLGRKKRGRDTETKVLAITCGEGTDWGVEEGAVGPKQKKMKEVLMSSLTPESNATSARAARQQPRRAQ